MNEAFSSNEGPSLAALRSAWVTVNLRAIANNVRALRRWLSPHTHLMAVVKADGYGHGSLAVAQTAISAGADWIAVATVSEGIRLRQTGTKNPLLLLSLLHPDAYETAIANALQLTVSSAEALETISRVATAMGLAANVHLKIDTGMTRIGAPIEDLPALVKLATTLPDLLLLGISTHLACAENTATESTEWQLAQFQEALTAAALPPSLLRHAANSAATLYYPHSHWDMVRPGLMIYGITPSPARSMPFPLEPALSVYARVVQVREVSAGIAVGYGWRYTTPCPTRLAILPIGYADGLPRALSGHAQVLLHGRHVPIVGTISMDQCIIDVGRLAVSIGDEAVLLGQQGAERIGVEEWAAHAQTIPYEIVCGLGRRLPKLFLR
ncbi:MAG: alanine racemase [Cyanobacteria bacterium NC_groundwater_1444_Ag_S-0.65um_54_12]|nr:alanine racemase [Cyanobacteria bacterium NC_groundwater_1444_Ag_S-0.65um_54_12]